jgi:hypothetical protein
MKRNYPFEVDARLNHFFLRFSPSLKKDNTPNKDLSYWLCCLKKLSLFIITINTEPTDKNAELLTGKSGGIYSYHWAFKVQLRPWNGVILEKLMVC